MLSSILKKTSILFSIVLAGFSAEAQKASLSTVSSGNQLLAALDKKSEHVTAVKEATAIYPDILTGNEAPSADYLETFSKNRREYLIRTYKKGKTFFKKAGDILKKYDLPQELNVLLALESGFNGNAVSGAGAAGYWQFMDATAKEYGLKIVAKPFEKKVKAVKGKATKAEKISIDSLNKIKKINAKDDRRNFNKSTYAAAKYLRDRSRNLNNDWLLVVASYNCGIGNVWDAMAASGKTNPTFWDVKDRLHAETRAYVMNFIAMNVVFNNYDKFTSNQLTFKPTEVLIPGADAGMNDASAVDDL